MCRHDRASTRSRYDRKTAELHCEIVCDGCGRVIRRVETVQDYRPTYTEFDLNSPRKPAA